MKKTIGILLIILGLWMLIAGIVAITNATTISHTPGGEILSTLSQSYKKDIQTQQLIGLSISLLGLIFTISGIVMVSRKTKNYKSVIENKNIPTAPVSNVVSAPNEKKINTHDAYLMLEKLAKFKEQGILTEEEFMEEKKRILSNVL